MEARITEASSPAAEAGAPPAVPAWRRSPLHRAHLALGAKMVPFGGWEMPLCYPEGTVAEHRACRQGAVAFDVSHLGTVRVEGPGARQRLQSTLTNDLDKVGPGRAQYTHLLADDGSVTDDLIVWWLEDDPTGGAGGGGDRFDVMPNASNTARVLEALGGTDTTADRAVIAVQGPQARRKVEQVLGAEAAQVRRFGVHALRWDGEALMVAGTGYTGEDGLECAVPSDHAPRLWEALVEAGAVPAGLGARDTLRLEAGLPLHGHELGPGITPLQAGLGWVVGWDKGDFPGRAALERERREGPARRLRGLATEGRQPPREGATVRATTATAGGGSDHPATTALGTVTSGNFSPMLGHGIALALIDTAAGLAKGDPVVVEVRGRELAATAVDLPFWPPSAP